MLIKINLKCSIMVIFQQLGHLNFTIQSKWIISCIKNNCVVYIYCDVFYWVSLAWFLEETNFPYMVRMFTLVILEIIRIWSSMVVRAWIFRNSPASVTYISHSFWWVWLRLIIFYFKSKFSMMSVMLEGSNKLARIE